MSKEIYDAVCDINADLWEKFGEEGLEHELYLMFHATDVETWVTLGNNSVIWSSGEDFDMTYEEDYDGGVVRAIPPKEFLRTALKLYLETVGSFYMKAATAI